MALEGAEVTLSEAKARTPRYLLFVWLLGPQGGQVSSAGLDAELAIL